MGLTISVPDVEKISENLWKGGISPSDARVFGQPNGREGGVTIVLLIEKPQYSNRTLNFKTSDARLVNLGYEADTIFIYDNSNKVSSQGQPNESYDASFMGGDLEFINEIRGLPLLEELGKKLLTNVRKVYPGKLVVSTSGRYVETPDNFWTIKVQPRDKSFSITVRGWAREFSNTGKIELKNDRNSYSRFKINNENQIPDFLKILSQAKKRNR